MINFERISWHQILTLFKVIHSSSSLSMRIIARWYNSESTNFNDTLDFFEKIGVIKIKDNIIQPDVVLKRTVGINDELTKQFFILVKKYNTISTVQNTNIEVLKEKVVDKFLINVKNPSALFS